MTPRTDSIRAGRKAKRLGGTLHGLNGSGWLIKLGDELLHFDTFEEAETELDRRLTLQKIAELEQSLGMKK